MTTFTAIGPALDLSAPTPEAPRHSLLNTPGVVVSRDGGRWMNGVNLWEYPEATPSTWEPCANGTFRTKADGEGMGTVRFDSFVVYLPITCSAIGMADDAVMEFFDRAEAALDAKLSMGVEDALVNGIDGSTNPFVGDSNMTSPTGSTAVSPSIGLAYLEDAIGSTGIRGMVHATPGVIARLQALPLGGADERLLETANGSQVVSGDGYIGARPVPYPGSLTATQDWIFGTGPVEVRLGPVAATTIAQNLDRTENILTYRAERSALVTFDTQLQVGVKVDWAT